MKIQEKALSDLEFTTVLQQLSQLAITAMGKERCLELQPFENEAEAIKIANDTPYGLAAYLQTGDPQRAERVAARLRAGAVHINGGGFNYGSPFGGYKQSGNGREGGLMGLEDYLETKTLHGLG